MSRRHRMKQSSTLFLKFVIYLISITVLAVCVLVLPSGISSDVTGYYRPILLGLYLPAIPFYVALFQSLKLLNYIDQNQAFSNHSVEAFKKIKFCAIIIAALFTLGMPYIYYAAELDDAPGVIAVGLVIIFASVVIGTFAAVLQKLIENAVAIKSENDLTV